jgi:hypothetical protein
MSPSIIPAIAALAGSLLGGLSTFAASWLTSRAQYHAQKMLLRAKHLEQLYAEFITEASRHLVSSWGNQMQTPEPLAGLYSVLERIRLASSEAVVSAAENLMQQVVTAYNAPNKPYDELQRIAISGHFSSPLTEFSRTCRAELRSVGG